MFQNASFLMVGKVRAVGTVSVLFTAVPFTPGCVCMCMGTCVSVHVCTPAYTHLMQSKYCHYSLPSNASFEDSIIFRCEPTAECTL